MSGASRCRRCAFPSFSTCEPIRSSAVRQILINGWFCENVPLQHAAPPFLMKWLGSFKEFPPRAKAATFTIDKVVEKLIPKD